jgi:drug/metabolite transporter (DMT)-like permease
VFGDVPRAEVWIGAAIVIASGLYLFYRERQR